ncbi:hypothetical protein OG984_02530 [Nocardioides sp. NBC_00368]|uniref:hypothetical protein n=1 Tax=unclassified Nocardioides TaxID=2615069 RepID=UPI0019A02CA3|nr:MULTISPECIES: hypothetical protein [unclassified Nocardioides]MBC7277091.1 hypothetical protein [Nocardioides sp.]
MTPAAASRFPLVARPRPTCLPLPQRVSGLHELATEARERRDASLATAVFNLAALLASDCGMPALARTWCHRLAITAIEHDHDPRYALEPVVNLARLHIRAGEGSAAWTLLETLFQAIDTRTDTTIDGLTIPAARLTRTPDSHAKARTWLWSVLLGTGAHAFAAAGRWDEASIRLDQHNGVGERMLDGRQVTIIAHATAGRYQQARTMLNATHPGEPWENAVTAALHLHLPLADADPAEQVAPALAAHHALGSIKAGLTVFHTRLGLTLVDALGPDHPNAEQIAMPLIRHAANDGYAARDLLAHPGCLSIASPQQIARLTELVADCGLGHRTMTAEHLAVVADALDTAESVIAHTALGQYATEPKKEDEKDSDETSVPRRGHPWARAARGRT